MPKAFLKIFIPIVVVIVALVVALNFVKGRVDRAESMTDGVKVGEVIPDFQLFPLGKPAVSFSEFAKPAKLVLINFWATWCEACIIEMPSLIELRDRYKDKGLEVVLISVDDEPQTLVPPFLKRLKIDFQTYFDEGQALSGKFEVHGIPFTAILTSDGKFLYSHVGDRDWNSSEVHQQVEKWLANR